MKQYATVFLYLRNEIGLVLSDTLSLDVEWDDSYHGSRYADIRVRDWQHHTFRLVFRVLRRGRVASIHFRSITGENLGSYDTRDTLMIFGPGDHYEWTLSAAMILSPIVEADKTTEAEGRRPVMNTRITASEAYRLRMQEEMEQRLERQIRDLDRPAAERAQERAAARIRDEAARMRVRNHQDWISQYMINTSTTGTTITMQPMNTSAVANTSDWRWQNYTVEVPPIQEIRGRSASMIIMDELTDLRPAAEPAKERKVKKRKQPPGPSNRRNWWEK